MILFLLEFDFKIWIFSKNLVFLILDVIFFLLVGFLEVNVE